MPWEDGVTPEPAAPAAAEPAPAGGKPAKGGDSITLTRAEHEALLRERDELRTSERYWADRVRGGKRDADPEPDPEPEEDILADIPEIEGDIDPDKWTDELSSKPKKALEDLGFISKKRMQAILAKQEERFMSRLDQLVGSKISGAQQQMLKDAELLSAYPELNDARSPFFKRTQEVYQELIADEPGLKKGAGIKIAARMVRAEMGKQAARRASVDERIAMQQGDMGDGGEGEDDELTPYQKEIIRKFNQDGGVQIQEEAYKRRAKGGVNRGGGYAPGSMRW